MKFNYEPLISVVIPIYNVEKYLRQCLDSVTAQTYKNLEIICVNDCSTDNCAKILEEFEANDNRIKIINNEKNLGLGLSRNAGIKVVTGEYVHCLDSDDWLELDGYEKLVKILNNIGKVDIIRFCFSTYYNNYKVKKSEQLPKIIDNKIFNFQDTPWIIEHWFPSAWAKLVSREFITNNNLYYNDYRCLEDIEYSVLSIIKAKSVYFTSDSIMFYRANRKGSLLSKKYKYLENVVKDTDMTNEISKDLPEQLRKYLLSYLYTYLINMALGAYYYRKIGFDELKEIYKNHLQYSILSDKELFKSNYNALIYNRIVSYTPLHFRISYCVRQFIKVHFQTYTKIYFYLKKVFKK